MMRREVTCVVVYLILATLLVACCAGPFQAKPDAQPTAARTQAEVDTQPTAIRTQAEKCFNWLQAKASGNLEQAIAEYTQADQPARGVLSASSAASEEGEAMPIPAAEALPWQSVVQIFAVQFVDEETMSWISGSGSIVDDAGYILTNAHVVLDDKNYDVDMLVVSMTYDTDQPPEPTYLAEVVVADPDLDLAVIRVICDPDGRPVDYTSLNLPTVPMGDSDELELGTPISILGYPGIGGRTITLTRGEVAGFDTQPGVTGRAYIKTSATMAGGNSGGMAITGDGLLIGVPTQLFSGSVAGPVDCRVMADTNADGVLDDRDGCVPVGGFVNALRPINLAKPFIQDALEGVVAPPESKPPGVEALQNAGELIYSDDFSADSGDWYTGSDEVVMFGYEAGEYFIQVKSPDLVTWSPLPLDSHDVIIEVDARQVSGPNDNKYGVFCRFQDEDNWYEFDISGDGYYAIFLQQGGEFKTLAHWTATTAIEQGPASNHLSVLCQGDRLAMWINGRFVAELFDDTLSQGGIALVAGSFYEPDVLVAFDNLRVSQP